MRKHLIALVVLVLCLAPAAAATGVRSEGTRTITVMFHDTAGLFVGNDVGVLGIPVGKVERISPSGKAVRVTLEVTDPDVEIPADAGAVIVSRSVATDRYVELTPVYKAGSQMRDGATIPLSRTQTPVDFDRVLSSLKGFADGLTDKKSTTRGLRDVIDTTARVLGGRGHQLNRTIAGLASAVDAMHAQKDDSIGTIKSLSRLSLVLSRNDGTVRRFTSNLADGTDLLVDERQELGTATSTLGRAIDDLTTFSTRHRRLIRTYLTDLTKVLRNTNRSSQDIKDVLTTFPLAVQNLDRSIASDGRLAVQINPAELAGQAALVNQICAFTSEQLCQSLSIPPSLSGLVDAVTGLAGGLGRSGRSAAGAGR